MKRQNPVNPPVSRRAIQRTRADFITNESVAGNCCAEHYLHNSTLVGGPLRYAAELNGQWVALLVWSNASYPVSGHDLYIG